MQPTIVQDAIAIIMTIWVCYANYKSIPVTPDILLIWKVAIGVFFSDKTGITDIIRTGLKSKIVKPVAVILFAFIIFGSIPARADIFKPIGPGTNSKYKAFLTSVNGPSGNTLTDLSNILNYLGATSGEAYNVRLKQWDTTVGATAVTIPAYNLSIGAETLLSLKSGSLIDGWAETNSFNVGQWLNSITNVATVPVLQYITAASISIAFGEETNSKGNYEFSPLIGGSLKWSFGPQG